MTSSQYDIYRDIKKTKTWKKEPSAFIKMIEL